MSEIKAITFNGKDKRFKVLADITIDEFFISAWRDYRKKVILYREINEKIINLYVKQYNLKMQLTKLVKDLGVIGKIILILHKVLKKINS